MPIVSAQDMQVVVAGLSAGASGFESSSKKESRNGSKHSLGVPDAETDRSTVHPNRAVPASWGYATYPI